MSGKQVTVVIPNYNGIKYIEKCLDSLKGGSLVPEIIVVDNASTDGSFELIRDRYPEVTLLRLKKNTGFCHAVNSGLHITQTTFVMLLNNDAYVGKDCVQKLYEFMVSRGPRTFSAQAKILSLKDPNVLDDAGDFYCALGWAFARGKMEASDKYDKVTEIFSACGCAAMYRRKVFERIGYFDERHFCYLEDVDIGWRAMIYGYRNMYCPDAVVYHAGSASSGSVHNEFKEVMAAGNNRYLLYKNLPGFFYIMNRPFAIVGEKIKYAYFKKKGLGKAFADGMERGAYLIERAVYEDAMRKLDSPEKGTIEEEAGLYALHGDAAEEGPMVHPLYLGGKVPFTFWQLIFHLKIQWMLLKNTGLRFLNK